MVLAELSGGVALILEELRDGGVFRLEADRRAGDAHFREAGAIAGLAGDERGAPRGATLLAVGVGETHPFVREAIDVRRAIAHQAVAVAAEIRDADVVAPDDENVRLGSGAAGCAACARWGRSHERTLSCQDVHNDMHTLMSVCTWRARTAVPGTRVGHHAGAATRRRTPARRIGALGCRGHWTKGHHATHARCARARRAKGQYVSAVSRR